MKSRLRDPIIRFSLAALAAGCWSLAAGSLGAIQVLTLPVVSSSSMGVKLSVDPGSGLGTASDTKTPNVQGTVLVQLDDNGTPTQIALRDFTLQPQNNNPLTFNGNVTASGTTGDFTWDGSAGGNWSDLHWNPGRVAGPTSGTATATINSGSVNLTSGVDYTGATTINGGGLSITGAGQLDASAAWSGRSVKVTGGTLEIDKWNGAGSLGTASYEADNVMIRNDYAPGVSMTLNVANGDAATDLLISGGISQAVSGAGVTKTGAGTLVLAGSNTYAGNTTVNGGSLILATGGSLSFHPTANHVCNQITGTGSPAVTLNGTLYLDLAGADLSHGNTWTLVDVANVTTSYGVSVTVTSSLGTFSNNADVWQLVTDGRTWTFSQATGQLTLETDPFDSWINATWPLLADKTPAGDPDHDGISNLMEYALQHGDPSLSSTAILPTANASGNDLVFTFHRRNDSAADTTQTFQYGSDLSGWTEVSLTDGGMIAITPDTPDAGIDEVLVTVPKNGNPSLFGRLKVSK
jgi:autotransporter-associated beta strand protein